MKNYNKILEAVNRGIQLALDDYQDDEPNSSLSQQNDIIDNEDVIKYRIDLMKEVVDLGLPSGTLWCKYNLGVNPNQLSKPEDWYGDYYAWGEITTKSYYGWEDKNYHVNDYKWAIGEKDQLTKYCTNYKYGRNAYTDLYTKLFIEDDAAYQNMHLHNFKFHIPTKEQFEELQNNTTFEQVRNYSINGQRIKGLHGTIFKSKNGNEIFFPNAGFYYEQWHQDSEDYNYLWTSNLDINYPYQAYYFSFSGYNRGLNKGSRCTGHSIRPVINL